MWGPAAFMAAVSNGRPLSASRSFTKASGTFVPQSAKDNGDSPLEDRAIGPWRVGVCEAGIALWEECRLGIAALELANDQLAIAVDVGANLHHRNAAVAAGKETSSGLGMITGSSTAAQASA